eukprot:6184094-Pleurochrysis_carterae.AAC.1
MTDWSSCWDGLGTLRHLRTALGQYNALLLTLLSSPGSIWLHANLCTFCVVPLWRAIYHSCMGYSGARVHIHGTEAAGYPRHIWDTHASNMATHHTARGVHAGHARQLWPQRKVVDRIATASL